MLKNIISNIKLVIIVYCDSKDYIKLSRMLDLLYSSIGSKLLLYGASILMVAALWIYITLSGISRRMSKPLKSNDIKSLAYEIRLSLF